MKRPPAQDFFNVHSPHHSHLHSPPLSTLSALSLPSHIPACPLAARFRRDKYVIRMSRGGFGLVVGWLSSGGIEGGWDTGGMTERGKEAVRGVVNERIQVDGEISLLTSFTLRSLPDSAFTASKSPPRRSPSLHWLSSTALASSRHTSHARPPPHRPEMSYLRLRGSTLLSQRSSSG